MKTVVYLICFISLVACNSNKSSNSTSNNIDDSEELVPLEKVEAQTEEAEEITEPNVVAEPISEESNSSVYGKWSIVSIKQSGKTVELPYKDWDMQLTFEEENENVSIKSPCNSGSCAYVLNNDKITIQSNCGFTEMYCEEEQKNKWEKKLVEVLSNQTDVESIEKNTLRLKGPEYSVELRRI